jgi:hypothetical protein
MYLYADDPESDSHKLAIQRYQVKSVRDGEYMNEHNQSQPEKVNTMLPPCATTY